MRDYLNKLREKKPVILSGDLNVAHTDLDVYNFQAKHLLKQAGTTLREKNAFSTLLSTGYEDALRYFYPGTFNFVFALKIILNLPIFCFYDSFPLF